MYQQHRGFPLSLTLLGMLALPALLFGTVACTDQQNGAVQQEQPMDHSQHNDHIDHAAHEAMIKSAGKYHVTEASYTLPDVKLVDMTNKEVALTEIFDTDKPTLVNFIFTTCTTICPVMTATFSQFQDQLGQELEQVQMVSISIDPEQDTPQKLLEYAFKFQAAPMWNFYTGKKDDVINVLKAFDVYRGDKMNHAPVTLLRKGKQSAWVRLEGLTSAADLVTEYRKVVAK